MMTQKTPEILNADITCMLSCKDNTLILDFNNLGIKAEKTHEFLYCKFILNEKEYLTYLKKSLYINGTQSSLIQRPNHSSDKKYADYEFGVIMPLMDGIITLYINEYNPALNFTFDIEIYGCEKDKREADDSTIWYDDYKIPTLLKTIKVFHTNCLTTLFEYNDTGKQIATNSSFMLTRTLPNLTGNVKLCIHDNNIALSNLSYTLNGGDNPITFINLDNSGNFPLHISQNLTSINVPEINEDSSLYEYGVEINEYENNETSNFNTNLKIFAPLYIYNKVPNYFIIFKCPIDKTNTSKTKVASLYSNIKKSTIIKIISLKQDTEPGQYLNNYLNKYLSQYLKYTDPFVIKNNEISFYGINYKEGIFSQTPFSNIEFNELTNNVVSSYNLLHPRILNLEFYFNDNLDSTTQYFGLYMDENELNSFSFINPIKENNSYTGYNTENNVSINLTTYTSPLFTDTKLNDRIYLVNNGNNEQKIVKNITDINSFIQSKVINNTSTLICNTKCEKCTFGDITSFLILKFSNTLNYGEHFKFIKQEKVENETKFIVLEIITSNNQDLLYTRNQISTYINTNTNSTGNIETYTITMYADKNEPLSTQIKRFQACISKFDSYIYCNNINSNTISICSLLPNIIFQHILPANYDKEYDWIVYYNCEYKTKVINNNIPLYNGNKDISPFNSPIYDITFNRKSSIIPFINKSLFDNCEVYEIDGEYDAKLIGNIQPIYQEFTLGKYTPLISINILTQLNLIKNNCISNIQEYLKDNLTYEEYIGVIQCSIFNENQQTLYKEGILYGDNIFNIISVFNPNKHLICLPKRPLLKNGNIAIYNSQNMQLSVMGIYPIKDNILQLEYTKKVLPYITFDANTILLNNGELHEKIKLFHIYQIVKGNIGSLKTNDKFYIASSTCLIKIQDNTQIAYPIYNLKITLKEQLALACLEENIYEEYNTQPPQIYKTNKNKSIFNFISKFPSMESKIPNIYSSINTNSSNTHLHNLNDNIKLKNGVIKSIRNIILDNETNAILRLYGLYTNDINVSYFNTSTGEFSILYNGIEYKIVFNYNYINEVKKLGSLYDYKVIVVCEYDNKTENEIFISKQEKRILFVIHSYNYNNGFQTSYNIKIQKESSLISSDYYWSPAPFIYNFINSIYNKKDMSYMLCKQYLQNMRRKQIPYLFTQTGYPIYNNGISDFNETGYTISYKVNEVQETHFTDYTFIKGISSSINSLISCSHDLVNKYRIPRQYNFSGNFNNFYSYFLITSRYNQNHYEYINVTDLNDGISDYDTVSKQDNRLYAAHSLYYINDTKYVNYSEDVYIQSLNSTPWKLYLINNKSSMQLLSVNDDVQVEVGPYNENTLLNSDINFNDIVEFDIHDTDLSNFNNVDYTYCNTKLYDSSKLKVDSQLYDKMNSQQEINKIINLKNGKEVKSSSKSLNKKILNKSYFNSTIIIK